MTHLKFQSDNEPGQRKLGRASRRFIEIKIIVMALKLIITVGAHPKRVLGCRPGKTWLRCHLTPQIDLLRGKGVSGSFLTIAEQFTHKASSILKDYNPEPSFLHGDLER